jgi:lysophospholipase
MKQAPLYNDIAEGPQDGAAYWLTAADGVRLRAAYWPGGDKGSVFLFPGRTEYIEKYGLAAAALKARGYGTLTIDWRGQGLADRFNSDAYLGDVGSFADYQLDVAELTGMVQELGCPRPWYLLAHSMGGCIGLRAMHLGLAVNAVAFSGPMWGISLSAAMRPAAWALSWATHGLRWGRRYSPGTARETYVREAPYDDNMLTTDSDMYAYMQRHADAHPELMLAGPSLRWLYAALVETRALRTMAPPDIPVVTHLGGKERVVDVGPVHHVMARWKRGQFEIAQGAEHEIILEIPQVRNAFFDQAAELFSAHPD